MLVDFIKQPLTKALENYYQNESRDQIGGLSTEQDLAVRNLDMVAIPYYIERDTLLRAIEGGKEIKQEAQPLLDS